MGFCQPSGIHNLSFMFVVLCLVLLAAVTAGCIATGSEESEIAPAPVPSDLAAASGELINDILEIDRSIVEEAQILSEKLGAARSPNEQKNILNYYYGSNIWIDEIICFDESGTVTVSTPQEGPDKYQLYIPSLDGRTLPNKTGEYLNVDAVYIPGTGYIDTVYVPIFAADGTYKGYLLIGYGAQVALIRHPAVLSKETRLYGDYICTIIDESGKIVYSSMPQHIGQQVPSDRLYRSENSMISRMDGPSGAYSYTSPAFYIYKSDEMTRKTTMWRDFSALGTNYTLYLTKEQGKEPLDYGEIFTPDVAGMHDAVLKYSAMAQDNYGIYVLEMIKQSEYPYLYAVSSEGKILSASSFGSANIGQNFMNARGPHGVSFMEMAIYTAEMGGGYVYYVYSVDGTVRPEAGIFVVGYVLPVTDDWFIYAFTPGSTSLLPVNYDARSAVMQISRNVVDMATLVGIDTVIEAISEHPGEDAPGMFIEGDEIFIGDIGVVDYDGYLYASTKYSKYVGSSVTGLTDALGVSNVRRAIMAAKAGGGMLNDLQRDGDGSVILWLAAVEPLGEENTYILTSMPIGTYHDYVGEYVAKQDALR